MTRIQGPAAHRYRLDWTNTLFLVVSHLLAVGAIAYMIAVQASWWTGGLALLWFGLSALSVTGGYHRLFAHRAYQAAGPLKAFYLLFGAAAVQNSALKWASDHRRHHAFTDQTSDPYNIRRGFWWAHIGWVFCEAPSELRAVRDLQGDRLVALQHRFYVPLAILMGAVFPALFGLAWGDPWGALLVAGFLRLVVQWHATFAVNSVAHCIGSQPFCRKTSARNSFLTALITLGEGYHNFHHRFQADYRNGVRWWHFDPTKWFVWSLSKVGVARNLKRTSIESIRRARAKVLAGE